MSEARNFLDENQEALKLLAQKMKEVGRIDTLDTQLGESDLRAEVIGRRRAVDIVETWLDELFEIKKGELVNLASDEDDLIKYREQVESR